MLLPYHHVSFAKVRRLSIIYNKSISDVADAVAVESATSGAVRDCAAVVEVVGATATVTFSITTCLQDKRLCDVVVLVAVGAGAVVADDTGVVLAYLGNGEFPNNKAT